MFYSNHQLGQKRILSFSSVIKAFLAELFNDVPELSDLDSLQCLPLAPKSYACIICAFLCIHEISGTADRRGGRGGRGGARAPNIFKIIKS